MYAAPHAVLLTLLFSGSTPAFKWATLRNVASLSIRHSIHPLGHEKPSIHPPIHPQN
jgi:hypothetical protein